MPNIWSSNDPTVGGFVSFLTLIERSHLCCHISLGIFDSVLFGQCIHLRSNVGCCLYVEPRDVDDALLTTLEQGVNRVYV
jgi:hypothetical protein